MPSISRPRRSYGIGEGRQATTPGRTTSGKSYGCSTEVASPTPSSDLLVEVVYERNASVHDGSFAITEIDALKAAIELARRYSDAVGRAT